MSPEEDRAVRRSIAQGVPVNGPHVTRLNELAYMKPEIAGVDALSFSASVTSGGAITQPSKQTLPGGYYAELVSIRGYMQNPATNPQAMPFLSFNVRDEDRTTDLFTTDLEMAYICSTQATVADGLYWPGGLYVFDPGARVGVSFSANASYSGGETKLWGVLLLFNLYASKV